VRRLSLIAVCCVLTACLGDPYTRPALDVPVQYRFEPAETAAQPMQLGGVNSATRCSMGW